MHDAHPTAAAAASLVFATIPWLETVDRIVSIAAGLASIAAAIYAIAHYRRMRRNAENAKT